ncbi:hypothetical protein GQX73_g1228 [Xylaria multiplex]|uniref:2EXR domain-containing protein n=1 Tax=Xylaria multiplex TaxID=323545 RepID=A0A7C8MWQ1_9PEZI|nr:hypothetical protein GQX73_g1228 [Xylaria multiplex]
MAQQAEEEDQLLWASSSSVEEYEERKRTRDEERRLDREAFMQAQPIFHQFPHLPTELRLLIWELALEEPTRVTLAASRYYPRFSRPRGQWILRLPEEFVATAFLPPLMLVNHESHAVAVAYYRRAFRGVDGSGGVLAGYPTVLNIKNAAFELLRADDLDLVRDFIFENQGLGNEGLRYYVSPKYHGKQYRMVFSAPNLETLVVRAQWVDSGQPPWLCHELRDLFVEMAGSHPDLKAPEVELEIDGPVNYDGVKKSYRFRGSPLELPEA